MNLFWI
ncbi:Long-chain-fatty-acid--CoA ligase, partial [Haemophilus influenzae]